jgi:hypothetical protein
MGTKGMIAGDYIVVNLSFPKLGTAIAKFGPDHKNSETRKLRQWRLF